MVSQTILSMTAEQYLCPNSGSRFIMSLDEKTIFHYVLFSDKQVDKIIK